MKKPISASSAIACRWRISALVLSRDDAVHDLLEAIRADVALVRPRPAVHKEGRRSRDAAGLSLLVARFDPPGVAGARQAGVELVPIQAEPAGEIPEEPAGVAGAATPLALREEQRVRHRPELPLLAGALRGEGRHARRSEEHTSELQSQSNLVCRLLLEKKKKKYKKSMCISGLNSSQIKMSHAALDYKKQRPVEVGLVRA